MLASASDCGRALATGDQGMRRRCSGGIRATRLATLRLGQCATFSMPRHTSFHELHARVLSYLCPLFASSLQLTVLTCHVDLQSTSHCFCRPYRRQVAVAPRPRPGSPGLASAHLLCAVFAFAKVVQISISEVDIFVRTESRPDGVRRTIIGQPVGILKCSPACVRCRAGSMYLLAGILVGLCLHHSCFRRHPWGLRAAAAMPERPRAAALRHRADSCGRLGSRRRQCRARCNKLQPKTSCWHNPLPPARPDGVAQESPSTPELMDACSEHICMRPSLPHNRTVTNRKAYRQPCPCGPCMTCASDLVFILPMSHIRVLGQIVREVLGPLLGGPSW